ncbi:MAG: hypothetical protein V1645_04045 [archaeon]
MRDYILEKGKRVDLKRLEAGILPRKQYEIAHAGTSIACHDIFIEYKGGIILGRRATPPDKGGFWPIGGRIKRGVKTEESLREKVREEASLRLEDITEIGTARTFLQTDPFGHGKGTDTTIIVHYGRGMGELRLNELNTNYRIITPQEYTKEFRKGLHSYVRDFMDIAIKKIRK